MNGAAFCSLLKRLGYGPHVSPSSFEWLFYDEASAQLLKWLFDNLSASNVLEDWEPPLYEALQSEGSVLQGRDLDVAFTRISKDEEADVFKSRWTQEESRRDSERLETKAALLQQRLAALQQQANAISKQRSAAAAGYESRESAALQVLQRVSDAKEKVTRCSAHLDGVLASLRDAAAELTHFHSGREGEAFVSFTDLTGYISQEEACTSALQHIFSKHFHEKPTKLKELEYNQVGRLPDADLARKGMPQISGTRQSAHERQVKELQRLRVMSEVGEMQLVEALAAREYAKAKLKAAQLQLKESSLSTASSQLARQRHDELQGELLALGKEEQKLQGEVIPKLAAEVARLQDALVLEGDYELKLARQEQQIAQLERLIDLMLGQRARHLFLEAACQVEQQQLASTRNLLRAVALDVAATSHAASLRTESCRSLADAAMLRAAGIGGADAGLDPLMDRVNEVLPPGCAVEDLDPQLQALRREDGERLPQEEASVVAQLQGSIRRLHDLLFTRGASSAPTLTPEELSKELAEVERLDAALSSVVERLNAEHQSKKQILQRRPASDVERKVFSDFFLAPDKLTTYAEELSEKLGSSPAT